MKRLNTLARNILMYRQERGLTQKELIAISKVSSIAMLESGARDGMQHRNLQKLAKALKVTVSDLYDEHARC